MDLFLSLSITAVWLFALTMLLRNGWVFKVRMAKAREYADQLRQQLDAGDHSWDGKRWWDEDYLSYDQMLLRFWVWDIEKMRKRGK